ncbi:MAG: MaoC family dehydratase N-terminal domain-containing protein [Rhizobiaceae bacterium]
MNDIDLDHLQQWIGHTETVSDIITSSLVDRFKAIFFDSLWQVEGGVPLGLHWCLAPIAISGNDLGDDGHPKRGGFLPPVPLPSRMWAGGELRFHSVLREGDNVTRNSRIANVALKNGKSGPLVFVTVEHECGVGGRLAISERQDIVYKQASPKYSASQSETMDMPSDPDAIRVDEVTLFRYSALTFNGHRIHYDRDYARNVEGYPGIVVHGPLQATLLMNYAAHQCNGVPARFSYRGIAPLFGQTSFRLQINNSINGGDVWCEDLTGNTTMQADYDKA